MDVRAANIFRASPSLPRSTEQFQQQRRQGSKKQNGTGIKNSDKKRRNHPFFHGRISTMRGKKKPVKLQVDTEAKWTFLPLAPIRKISCEVPRLSIPLAKLR